MEAFGVVLWFSGFAILLGACALAFRLGRRAPRRLAWMYLGVCLSTLPLPLLLSRAPWLFSGGGPWALLAGLRHLLGVPLALLGGGLACWSRLPPPERSACALTGALNALVFVLVFLG